MFFLRPAEFDAVWPAVVRALVRDQLGAAAKVGGGEPNERVCCVDVTDFMDSAGVKRVRDVLAGLLCRLVDGTVQLMLKPDVYTHCGIDAVNQWKIPCYVDTLLVHCGQLALSAAEEDVSGVVALASAIEAGTLDSTALLKEVQSQGVGFVDSLHSATLLGKISPLHAGDLCSAVASLLSIPARTWTVDLQKVPGEKLAVNLLEYEKGGRIVERVDAGPLASFNASRPDQAVQTGDIISQVNGMQDDIWGPNGECRRAAAVNLKVMRPVLSLKQAFAIVPRVFMTCVGLMNTQKARLLNYSSHIFIPVAFRTMHMNNIHFLGQLCVRELVSERMLTNLLKDLMGLRPERRTWTQTSWAFLSECVRALVSAVGALPPPWPSFCEEVVYPGLAEATCPSTIQILTLNLWFDPKLREARIAALLAAVRALHPSVCCFQEVVPAVAMALVQGLPDWTASDPGDGSSVGCYGVMALVAPGIRAHFSFQDFPSQMGRQLLVAELPGLAVGTVHLESLMSQPTRECQLKVCAEVLALYPDAVLVGDFNFDSEKNFQPPHEPLHNAALARFIPDFIDIWPALRSDRGLTFDSNTNPYLKKKSERMRYDRVLARLADWKPTAIDYFGKGPLDGVVLSDHYGLLSVVERVSHSLNMTKIFSSSSLLPQTMQAMSTVAG